MTEDLKFIVAETNKLLKTEYNLISFDSLSVESLLQVLIDVLCKFGATTKVSIILHIILKDKKQIDFLLFLNRSMLRIQIQPILTNIFWKH